MKFYKYLFIVINMVIPLFIQAQSPDTLKNIKLDEIVVSVTRFEESKRNVVQQVQVIDRQEIQNLQPRTTADLLSATGNVFIQKSQSGGGSVSIRGFEASRIVMVVDGVRMNNLIYRAGHLQNVITIDKESLEKTEVLFGPSSTIYGSDALGGVVHFYTKKPEFSSKEGKPATRLNTLSRYGSVDNEHTEHIDFNMGGKKFASLTSVSYSSFGDLKGGKNQNPFYKSDYGMRQFYVERQNGKDALVANSDPYLQIQSAYQQLDAMQKFSFKQSAHIIHNLNFQFSTSTNIPRYDRLTDPSSSGLKYAEWYYGPQKRALGAYDFDYRNKAGFFQHIHFGLNYQAVEESRHTRKFNSNDLAHRVEDVNVMGTTLEFFRQSGPNICRWGMETQFNTLISTATSENILAKVHTALDTRYPDGDNSMLNTALYFSHTYRINKEIVLTDGARAGYSRLRSEIKNNYFKLPVTSTRQSTPVFSGNLGIVKTNRRNLKLGLMLSTGFRVPNIDDLSKIFETAKGSVIVPNNNLKPEKTINAEVNISKIFGQKTRWENSLYYTRFFDAIVTDKFQLNGKDSIVYDGVKSQVFANQNKRKAFIYGISSNITSQFPVGINISASINYTYGRIISENGNVPLDHIAPLMASFRIGYVKNRFTAGLSACFNGPKRLGDYFLNGEDNEQYATPEGMPAWVCFNVHATMNLTGFMDATLGIDNILDTQYRTFASGINAPGRNLFGSLRFHL